VLRRLDTNFTTLVLLTDLILTELALYLAQVLRFTLPYGEPLTVSQISLHPYVYAVVALIWTVSLIALVYQPRRTRRLGEELYALTLAAVTSTLLLAGALYLSFRDVSRLLFIYFFVIDLYLLTGVHVWFRLIRQIFHRNGHESRTLIIGAGKVGREIAAALTRDDLSGLTVVGYLDDDPQKIGAVFCGAKVLGPLDQAVPIIDQNRVEEVIFTLPLHAQEKVSHLALELQRLPVRVWIVPDYFDLAFTRTRLADLGGIPLIGLREPAIDGLQSILKRIFDLSLSALCLVFGAPILLLIAIAIKLDSPGPVIFKQQRVGENCRLFWMYKFRSMVVDAEKQQLEAIRTNRDGPVVHKIKDDPRVTRVGRFLRRTSLDELPQLFNVLKGEMSLVGPRPEMPWLVDRYEPWQRKRFAVPPGMTGWWQVNGRSERLMHLHTEDDLYYIQNYSLWLDLKILWKTIGVVLRGQGAY